jgi:hypothetical protein
MRPGLRSDVTALQLPFWATTLQVRLDPDANLFAAVKDLPTSAASGCEVPGANVGRHASVADSVWGLAVEGELGFVVDEVEQLHASAARATNAISNPFTQGTVAGRPGYQGAACHQSADQPRSITDPLPVFRVTRNNPASQDSVSPSCGDAEV